MTDEVGHLVLREQLRPDRRAQHHAGDGRRRSRQPRTLDRDAGKPRQARPRGRGPALRPKRSASCASQQLGLTRPELAVIMAYAKLDLFSSIVASKAPDDPAFEPLLVDYFPDELAKFGEARKRHRLRREIIATRAVQPHRQPDRPDLRDAEARRGRHRRRPCRAGLRGGVLRLPHRRPGRPHQRARRQGAGRRPRR